MLVSISAKFVLLTLLLEDLTNDFHVIVKACADLKKCVSFSVSMSQLNVIILLQFTIVDNSHLNN